MSEPSAAQPPEAVRKPPQGRPGGERPRRTSAAFDDFYRMNLVNTGLIEGGADWESFIDCLNRPLPSSFWITPTAKDADEVRQQMQEYHKTVEAMHSDAGVVKEDSGDHDQGDEQSSLHLAPISWMPADMGWCINVPKRILRRDPRFRALHEMLIVQTANGTINRMEEVSMLPVAMLDIGHAHRCLDMCASPGNKTAQMLSALGDANYRKLGRGLEAISSAEVRDCQEFLRGRIDYTADEGCVIANDISSERCGMLVHQISRHQSLYPLVLFTTHDARFFPSIRSPDGEEMLFDRILCDVMCSSDGTLRKSVHLWREWNPKTSLELHSDQLAVALRAARLLKVGGRMVYSTCSMSPIENEAVVAELLRCTHGGLELIDARSSIAPFRTCEGLRQWHVAHPGTRKMFASYSELVEADASHKLLRPGNFPPPMDSPASLALSKCVRILPHHNDTSGFFIAVFNKVGDIKPVTAPTPGGDHVIESITRGYDSDADADGEELDRERQVQRLEEAVATGKSEQDRAKALSRLERAKNSGSLARELTRYQCVEEAAKGAISDLSAFFGMHTLFPARRLYCRYQLDLNAGGDLVQTHQGETKQLFLCAGGLAEMLMSGTGEHARRKLKVVSGGLRAFEKDRLHVSDRSSSFRFCQESLELFLPYIRDRLVDLEDIADTRRLMLHKSRDAPVVALMSAGKTQLEALSPGGCVLLLRTLHGDRIAVPALRIGDSVNLYINDLVVPALMKACGLPLQLAEESMQCDGAAILTAA